MTTHNSCLFVSWLSSVGVGWSVIIFKRVGSYTSMLLSEFLFHCEHHLSTLFIESKDKKENGEEMLPKLFPISTNQRGHKMFYLGHQLIN